MAKKLHKMTHHVDLTTITLLAALPSWVRRDALLRHIGALAEDETFALRSTLRMDPARPGTKVDIFELVVKAELPRIIETLKNI